MNAKQRALALEIIETTLAGLPDVGVGHVCPACRQPGWTIKLKWQAAATLVRMEQRRAGWHEQKREAEARRAREAEERKVEGPLEGFVYALRNSDTGRLKVGRSGNARARAKDLGASLDSHLEVVWMLRVADQRAVEAALHRCLGNPRYRRRTPREKRIHYRGEWYIPEAASAIDQAFHEIDCLCGPRYCTCTRPKPRRRRRRSRAAVPALQERAP